MANDRIRKQLQKIVDENNIKPAPVDKNKINYDNQKYLDARDSLFMYDSDIAGGCVTLLEEVLAEADDTKDMSLLYCDLGTAYLMFGEGCYEEVLRYLGFCLDEEEILKGTHKVAYNNLALMNVECGDPDNAQEILDENGIKADAKNMQIALFDFETYLKTGDGFYLE